MMRSLTLTIALVFAALGGPVPAMAGTAPDVVAPPASIVETMVTLGEGELAVRAAITMPAQATRVPAIVLVGGSGPGTLDLNVGGSTIHRDLAWGLASHGVAVIRFEKRSTAHPEVFDRRGSPPTLDEEFREEALAALKVIAADPRVDGSRLYVVGGSQGGALAAGLANRHGAAGAVILSSSPRTVGEIIAQQADLALEQAGNEDGREGARRMRATADRIQALTPTDDPDEVIQGRTAAYWLDMFADRPLAQVDILLNRGGRVLVVQGARDTLMSMIDWKGWNDALAGRPNVDLRLYANLNHLLQEGVGPMTNAEYEWTRPVSDAVIEDMATWIKGTIPARP